MCVRDIISCCQHSKYNIGSGSFESVSRATVFSLEKIGRLHKTLNESNIGLDPAPQHR